MDNSQLAVIAGTLVVANIGTIVTVFISALKLAATFGALKKEVETNAKDINNAHGMIRELKNDVKDLAISIKVD